MKSQHVPVLYQTVLSHLEPQPGGCFIDGTLGGASHATGLLQKTAPDGRLLGLDVDPEAVARARQILAPFGDRAIIVHGSFRSLQTIAESHRFFPVDGILLDLGLSSFHLASPERGFSFLKEGPLDMRFDPSRGQTAANLVNSLSRQELANLLYQFGEERQSRRIAKAIVEARPLRTTTELAGVVRQAVSGRRRRYARIHPATQTFQALRIAVNDELGALEAVLPQAVALLRPGGRLAVISFHSLEDRIVKQFFRREAQDCVCPPEIPICVCDHQTTLDLITRKPIRPSDQETERNPRARSARLRVAEKI